jgi:hypothetical protein
MKEERTRKMPRTLTKVRVFNPGGLRRTLKQFTHADKSQRSNAKIPWAKTKYKLAASAKRKAARASNPPKRKLSLAQKLHFGTKRQRAAAGLMLSMAGKRKRVANGRSRKKFGPLEANRKIRKAVKRDFLTGVSKHLYRKKKLATRVGNPGEIITLAGLAGNPGRLRKRKVGIIMAKRRTRKFSGVRRRVRRTRRANPNVMVRYSRRRRNTGRVRSMRRRTHRRSNPGFLSGGVGMLVGIFGGAALTGAIAARIPGQLSSGIAGYLTTGVVAYAQGTLAGKLLKNPTLGKNMVTGGLIYLGLKIAGDLIPGLSLPFGLSGLGAIGSSNFSYPQIPANNTMLYASPTPVMAAAKGMGRIARMGRGY